MPKSRPLPTPAAPVDALDDLPGYCIRRLHQIAVAIFLQETEAHGITPVQYAVLQTVSRAPGIDQRRVARAVGLDTSTTGGVVDRLEARGLLGRGAHPRDRRVRALALTEDGRRLLHEVTPGMRRAQQRMLEPLPPERREYFTDMLRTLVKANNALSRAPSDA